MKYLQTAVSETAVTSESACSAVSKFVFVSPFAYPDTPFSGEFSICFSALVSEGREEAD